MFGLTVMNADYGWTRSMLTVFKQFTGYARTAAVNRRLGDDVTTLDQLELKFKALTKAHTDSKKRYGQPTQ